MTQTMFLFDFDGTVTTEEVLPRIAREIGMEEEMRRLTNETIFGNIPFDHSFNMRVELLRKVPIDRVRAIIDKIPFNASIAAFVREYSASCAVVTGNLDVWVKPSVDRLGARCFCSEALVSDSGDLLAPKKIIRKKDVVDFYKEKGFFVVAVGDGSNDSEMLAAADIGVAFGGVHSPAPSAIESAQYAIFDGERLCRIIRRLS